jgi:multidrug transporter EmrE-like cation transporter
MTLAAAPRRLARGRLARLLLVVAMPLLGVGNQYLAERTAHGLLGEPFGAGWLADAVRLPWTQAWVALEMVTFASWMVVLSHLRLSAAFPMTALGYVLVIGMGWSLFGEPVTWPQLAGGAAILLGVWLLAEPEAPR